MTTLLRSSRYIRCLNAFAQRIVVAHDKSNIGRKCLTIQARCIGSCSTRSYATIPAIQRKEIAPNYDNIFNALDQKVQRYGRVFYHEIEDVLNRIRDTGSVPSLDALLLIRCCGDLLSECRPEQRNHLAEEIWSTLNELKIPVDISHFNALLRVYLENNHQFSPVEFLSQLQSKGVTPNRVTYQRLILQYCRQGDIAGATKILEFMKEKDIPLNEAVFNALVTGHAEANDMESSKGILNIMKDVGIEPGASTYSALLCAYAKRGDFESIKETLKEAHAKEVGLSDKDYFDIVHALAANGHDNEIEQILSMQPHGVSYNIDAVHAILKILDSGNVDAAMKILATMKRRKNQVAEDESEIDSGTFLIRKLVNSKFPAEQVIKVCAELEQQGLHRRAFNIAAERALESGADELGLELLKAWKAHGGTLREHYFWPLMVARGKASNYQGINDLLDVMVKDMNILPGYETIRDYILPFTFGKWNETVANMRNYGVPDEITIPAVASRLLMDKKIRQTSMFMSSYPIAYDPEAFYRPMAEALSITGDAKSYVNILRFLQDGVSQTQAETGEHEGNTVHPDEVVETALRTLIEMITDRKAPYVDDVLTYLIEAGVGIKPEMGDALREYFRENATSETLAKIDKLTSGTLELIPAAELTEGASDVLAISEAGRMFSIKRRQLSTSLRTKNIEATKNILNEVENTDIKMTPGMYAQVVDAACSEGDLQLAEKWYNRLLQDCPEDRLDLYKSLKYAALLLTHDRFDDALQFLSEGKRPENPEDQAPAVKRSVKNLLDTVAATGDVEKTRKLFDTLLENNYFVVDNIILNPLVRVHLYRNDFDGAMEAFQHACVTYQCTPLKNELSKKFIDAEDANSLQRLTDLSTQIHGESNSLVDLVFSFIECGRSRQARKILETPGLRLRAKKLQYCVERYLSESNAEGLELLLDLTKNLPVMDRQELYDVYLEVYNKHGNWQGGLSLWTSLQEEDFQPNDTFLTTLANLLLKHQQPVPFIYKPERTAISGTRPQYLEDCREAIKNNDLKKAERILQGVSSKDEQLSTGMSELIQACAEQKKLDQALALAETLLLKHSRLPRASCLKTLWNALIECREFEKLRAQGNILSATIKKKLRFQKYLNRAALAEHGIHRCLDDFQSKLGDSKAENMMIVHNSLHFTTYLAAMKDDPSVIEKFRPIAEKLADQEIHLPINMLWCYYFVDKKPEAEELWSKYLSSTSWIVFKYLVEKATTTNDVDLIKRLNDKFWSSTALTENAKMTVLSTLVQLYVANKRCDEAVEALKGNPAVDIVRFHAMFPEVLQKLRDGLKSEGKSFPFQLPDTRQSEAQNNRETRSTNAVE